LATEFAEMKIDGDEASDGFNPKQKRGSECVKDPDGGSLLHLVKNSKWV